MNFEEAIENVKKILEDRGTSINKEEYDGIIVKKLEASNTLDEGRTTKQTHIAITGEQMNMFPYLRVDGYFEKDSAGMKKYFVMQIPVILKESNIKYLSKSDQIDMVFQSENIKTYTSIVRSKRKEQSDQIQMSLTTLDDDNFIKFRKMLHIGSYLIILKKYEKFEYECYGILSDDDNDIIQQLNNKFYGISTNTKVYSDQLIYNEKSKSINKYLSPEWFREKAKEYWKMNEEVEPLYKQFQSDYSIKKLNALDGKELLYNMFLNGNNTNLCYALERDHRYEVFGSIWGGSSYKFGLFYNKDTNTWKTIIGGQRIVSEDEAIEIGRSIRDALVNGYNIIDNCEKLDTPNDYLNLYKKLEEQIPEYISKIFFLKYYHMMFPEKLPNFYSEDWHKHILCNLNILPSEFQFVSMGQINCFVRECEISNIVFSKIILETIGKPKTFYRIGTGEKGELFNKNYVAIGWDELGDLSEIYKEENPKEIIKDKLASYYKYNERECSRKYGEINMFYTAVPEETYVVAMNGYKLLAVGNFISGYYYEKDQRYSHRRNIKWLKIFKDTDVLPKADEGKLTTFYPLTKSENLCYLYNELNNRNEIQDNNLMENKIIEKPFTGYQSTFAHNRIIFGAPGTGKSYRLNKDREELLKDGNEENYERVTFHPNYSYANFVGTYKPVPYKKENGEEGITYEYVPGPFMRIYVKALKNSMTNNIKPYLLIIEEINRANVAAVFGDVFQLLDRDENNVSEYPIEASEDVKKYLAKELGGLPEDYKKIYIPDNMFIWATMNSADQGVFPMDTAFKRRWEFSYLGIDEKEEGIANRYILLGNGEYRRKVEWNKLRKALNNKLSSFKVNEDKLLGPYFLSKKAISANERGEIDKNVFVPIFKGKVLMYLFEDAAKQKRKALFALNDDNIKYSSICKEFDEKGVYVFDSDISKEFDKDIIEEEN